MVLKLISIIIALCAYCTPAFSQKVFKELTQSTPRKIKASLIKPTLSLNLQFKLGPVVPGLKEGAIPQGLVYSEKHDAYLITHRFEKGEKKHLPSWISAVETKASFCTYHDGILYVGEFAKYKTMQKKFKTKTSHHMKDRKGVNKKAWICGYKVDNNNSPVLEHIFSIRLQVQGIHITNDFIFLSVSHGRKKRSKIVIYSNPLTKPSHKKVKIGNVDVPLWFLDGKNWTKTIDFPPMSQGITGVESMLAVLTESGAGEYQKDGLGPIDNIILIENK